MTVKELIAKLQELPNQNVQVTLAVDDSDDSRNFTLNAEIEGVYDHETRVELAGQRSFTLKNYRW